MSSTVSPQHTTPTAGADCTRTQIDPRGPRFGGAVTTVVLALALVLVGTTAGTILVAWQTLVFALGAIVGLQAQPYGILLPQGHPATAVAARGAGGCSAAAVRAGGRARLPRRGAHRLAGGRHGRGHGGHRVRARCGVPERRIRLLPRLRDVPARQATGPSLAARAARRLGMRRARLQPWLKSSTRACSSWPWPRPAGSRSTSSTSCSRDRARCWHRTARASRSTRTFARCPGSSADGSASARVSTPPSTTSASGRRRSSARTADRSCRYLSRNWLLDDDGARVRPLATEAGFWRPRPGNEIEVTLSHPTGFAEVWYGTPGGHGDRRREHHRCPRRPEDRHRHAYRQRQGVHAGPSPVRPRRGPLLWTFDMAAVGQPLLNHLAATRRSRGTNRRWRPGRRPRWRTHDGRLGAPPARPRLPHHARSGSSCSRPSRACGTAPRRRSSSRCSAPRAA